MTPAPNMCSWGLVDFNQIVPFSSCIPGRAKKVCMIWIVQLSTKAKAASDICRRSENWPAIRRGLGANFLPCSSRYPLVKTYGLIPDKRSLCNP